MKKLIFLFSFLLFNLHFSQELNFEEKYQNLIQYLEK